MAGGLAGASPYSRAREGVLDAVLQFAMPMKSQIPLISPKQYDLLLESIAAQAKLARHGLHDLPRDQRVFYALAILVEAATNYSVEWFLTKHSALLGDAITGLDLVRAQQAQGVLLRAASVLRPVHDINAEPAPWDDSYSDEEAEGMRHEHIQSALSDLDDVLMEEAARLREKLEEFAYRQRLTPKAAS